MDDKEILELAAKAAGIENLQWESDGTIQNRINRPTVPYSVHGMISAIDWNPLTDDGDAFRLARKMFMNINISREESATIIYNEFGGEILRHMHFDKGIEYASRRAIVRAAAQIGKVMP